MVYFSNNVFYCLGANMIISAKNSCLIVIDIQERIAPATDSPREVINGSLDLLKAAKILSVPYILTEQYSKGLGPTMIDLRNELKDNYKPIEKIHFSCMDNEQFASELKKINPKQVILCGVETHICILQTALALKEAGYEVFVVSDATSSRKKQEELIAYQRLSYDGVNIVTKEMVMFEWLEKAGTPEFKEISKTLIK